MALALTSGALQVQADTQVGDAVRHRDPALALSAVVDAALLRHPDAPLLDARSAQARALGRRADSLIGGDPAVFLRHESDRPGSDTGYREWESGVELPLWRAGERKASRRLGLATADDAQAKAALLRLEVAGEVRASVWEVALAENALEASRSALSTAHRLEAQVTRRVERGDLARTDRLLARDETLQRELDVREAQAALARSLLDYRTLTGLDALPATALETPVPANDMGDANPYRRAPASELERRRAELAQARESAAGSPVLFLGGKRTDAGVGESVDSLQVAVSVPFGHAHAGARRAEAAVAVAEGQAALARANRRLERTQSDAAHRLEAAREALALAEERARLAAESERAFQRGFDLGELTLTDYLREHRRALEAIHEAARRRLELGREIARFNQSMGVTP